MGISLAVHCNLTEQILNLYKPFYVDRENSISNDTDKNDVPEEKLTALKLL